MKLAAAVVVVAALSLCSLVGCSPKEVVSEPRSGSGDTAPPSGTDAGNSGGSMGAEDDAAMATEDSDGGEPTSEEDAMTSPGGTTGEDSGAGGGGAYVRQYSENAWSGIGVQEISATLAKPVLAGSTLVVFATEYNIAGDPPGSAAPDPIKIDDTSKAKYTLLRTLNDQADWQAVMMFARYNAAAGNITARASFAGLEWQGIVVVEIAGISAAPLITSTAKLTLGADTAANSVSSGTMALGSTPVLVIGFAMNINDARGAANAGTGFTAVGKAWNWNGAEGTAKVPSSLLVYGKFSDPGTLAATFTPVAAGDNFGALAVALKD